MKYLNICQWCGCTFTRSVKRKFCSTFCSGSYGGALKAKPKVTLICAVCSKEFKRKRSDYTANIRRDTKIITCSLICRDKGRIGKGNPNYIEDRSSLKNGNHSLRQSKETQD